MPLLSAPMRALWEWIASYYMCTPGEVMRVGLPSLMKPSGDTEEEFTEEEFRPRTECYVALTRELCDEERFHELCERIERRAPKQYEALLELASAGDGTRIATGEVARRLLRADRSVLHALERKGWITVSERERTVECGGSAFRLPELTPHQQQALSALRAAYAEGRSTALLQGITGSGKTEIYIHLIAEVLRSGGDVLLLVPEIALTAQLIERMERIFGSRVTAYHSKLTNRRRTETYLRLSRSDGGEFVVGVRSSIFLPLKHLQLVIVDEEHDASYKQTEPAPRYHARDCAVVMARLFGGRTLLGSATPSLESWLNARSGKYGHAVLSEALRCGPPSRRACFRYAARRAARRAACPLQQTAARPDRRDTRPGRAGDALPEPPRLLALRRLYRVRLDGALPPVQRDADLSQERFETRLPLLRPYGTGAGQMSLVPGDRRCAGGLRDREDRGGDCPRLPRGARGPARPRQRDLRAGLQCHHCRFCRTPDRHTGRHADDHQGVRLRGRLARGDPQCRQPAQQPRLPGLRAGLPADDAGGRTGRAPRRRRGGGDPDLRAGPSRHPPGCGGRLRGDGLRAACRARVLLLPALCAAHLPDAPPPRPDAAAPCRRGARLGGCARASEGACWAP